MNVFIPCPARALIRTERVGLPRLQGGHPLRCPFGEAPSCAMLRGLGDACRTTESGSVDPPLLCGPYGFFPFVRMPCARPQGSVSAAKRCGSRRIQRCSNRPDLLSRSRFWTFLCIRRVSSRMKEGGALGPSPPLLQRLRFDGRLDHLLVTKHDWVHKLLRSRSCNGQG